MYNSISMYTLKIIKRIAVVALFFTVSSGAVMAKDYQVLAFGDSLTAGYGLAKEDGFTAQLQKYLRDQGHQVTIINAGVSGNTTSGGLARLEWSLAGTQGGKPDLVLLALGGNDALRGIDPAISRANMDKMLTILQKANIDTLILGMMAPPNMGEDYENKFNTIFPDLAEKYKVDLYPFFLDGVAGDLSLNQGDAMHPNAQGVQAVVRRIAPIIIDKLLTP
ncbi:arylesterase [Paremcibacter congregatus]|uniref:Arylesterase n=2 Tax=Paremcibacter congregatus TaxID=2043170 RepID=A0A2G4YMQ4_9PROT|nr:arylesterase [Paremcibacter congregatus]QDE27302.1 arylesterase [Paremcibacter congregatus]